MSKTGPQNSTNKVHLSLIQSTMNNLLRISPISRNPNLIRFSEVARTSLNLSIFTRWARMRWDLGRLKKIKRLLRPRLWSILILKNCLRLLMWFIPKIWSNRAKKEWRGLKKSWRRKGRNMWWKMGMWFISNARM